MNAMAKALIVSGCILVVVGLLWQLVGRHFPLGRLPGDIAIKKGGVSFYFPIVSCILISVLFSLMGFLIGLFKK